MWYYESRISIEPDWNVKMSNSFSIQIATYQNRTRLECKETSLIFVTCSTLHQNRTRLECKVPVVVSTGTVSSIRIEPDWNVKTYCIATATRPTIIRIEPDWNVKFLLVELFITISHQNRTRLECKASIHSILSDGLPSLEQNQIGLVV